MKIKQAKLAQTIRGETSNIIESKKYDLRFEGGMLHVSLKSSDAKYGPFIIFPANIAWLEIEAEVKSEESKALKTKK